MPSPVSSPGRVGVEWSFRSYGEDKGFGCVLLGLDESAVLMCHCSLCDNGYEDNVDRSMF